jgi:hypothetical protein
MCVVQGAEAKGAHVHEDAHGQGLAGYVFSPPVLTREAK